MPVDEKPPQPIEEPSDLELDDEYAKFQGGVIHDLGLADDPQFALNILVTALRSVASELQVSNPTTIARSAQLMVKYLHDHGAFAAEGENRVTWPEVVSFLRLHLTNPQMLSSATKARGAALLAETERWFHPCIHVSPTFAMYSFPVVPPSPEGRTKSRRPLFMTLDSRKKVYPTEKEAGRFAQSIVALQSTAARQPLAVPFQLAELADPSRWDDAIEFVRRLQLDWVPFKTERDCKRFKAWCLSTFLYPLADFTPLLRVVVPNLQVARQMETLLENMCFHPLVVHRDDQARDVKNHRLTYAGVTILGPRDKRTGIPKFAKNLIASPPVSHRAEPPIAVVEILETVNASQDESAIAEPMTPQPNYSLTEDGLDPLGEVVLAQFKAEQATEVPVAGIQLPPSWTVEVHLSDDDMHVKPSGWGYRPCAFVLKAAWEAQQ